MLYITRWIVALVIYTNLVLLLLVARPALLFDTEGNPKPFGTGLKEGQSVLAPAIVFPLLAFLSYMFASWMHIVWV